MPTHTAMVMPAAGQMPAPVERAIPEPAAGEVLVRIRASSCNYHDLVNVMGGIPGPWPRVPMTDGAGEIVAVGPQVRGWTAGDRVILPFLPQWLSGPLTPEGKEVVPGDTMDGRLQQYACVDANTLVSTPPHLSDIEAATLPCAAVTAWTALRTSGLKAGDFVTVQGTGGVSVFALQLAKAHGATVAITSSSDDKLAMAAKLGADHGINYRTNPEWHQEIRNLTGGRGADLVCDVGGPDTLARSIYATRTGGTIAVVGALTGRGEALLPVATLRREAIRMVGVTVGSVADLAELCRVLETTRIQPQIGHTFGWDELPAAFDLQKSGRHFGKIAISIP